MIDLEFLESLIRAIDDSSLDSIEIERGGTRVRLSKTPQAGSGGGGGAPMAYPMPQPQAPAGNPQHGPAAAPAPTASSAEGSDSGSADAGGGEPGRELVEVTSPMVGTFYRAPSPDAPPYVEVGGSIAEGDTLCIIEAMKLMNELEAEVSGTIAEICVENAEPVEYGQVLFRVEP